MWETWQRRTTPTALARHGEGHGLHRRQRGGRRPRPHPSLPPPTSPTTRLPPRGMARQARRQVRQRRPARRPWSTTWPRSTWPTTPTIVPVLRALAGSSELRRARSALKVRDPGEDLVATYRALGVRDRPSRRARTPPPTQILWQAGNIGHRSVRVAATRRPADRQRTRGPPRRGVLASMSVHFTDERRVVAHRGITYRARTRPGCRSFASGSTTSSTTCPSSCCTGADAIALQTACRQAVGIMPSETSPATTRS